MNTTMKKLTAILAASCLLASLAACKGPETEPGATDSTLQNTAGQSWESQAISESRQSEEEGLESSRVSVSNSTATEASDRPKETAKQVDTTKKSPVQNQKPSTKAEIIAYFNVAANKVKIEKPGVKKIEEISFHVKGDGAIANIANKVQDALKKNGTLNPDPITVKKGAGHNAAFPVENQSWSSRLSAGAVSSASCVEKNGAYMITIRMKDEHISYEQARKPLQTKHGQVVDILKANEIDEQMKSLSWLVTLHDLDQTYSGTTIVCTIDAKSQTMRSAHYRIISNATIKASAPIVGDATVNATIAFDQIYQF